MSGASMTTVSVTTRKAWKAQMQETQHQSEHILQDATVPVPPTTESTNTYREHHETDIDTDNVVKPVKKPRISPPLKTVRSTTKRKKTRPHSGSSSSSRASSRQRTLLPEPESIYRCSRSRSTSSFPSATENHVHRQCWTEEGGTPGPDFVSSEVVVRDLMRTYKGYFKNLDDPEDTSFEPHPTNYPVTKLEYPNNDACESFILLTPKDKNHYDPIMCLELSLHAIIKSYLTPAQQSLFGTFPDAMFSDTSSPTPSPPSSSIDLPQDASTENSTLPVPPVTDSDRPDHLKLFQRALRRRDGLLFQKTMTDINHLLRTLKYPPLPTDPFASSPNNIFRETVKTWTSGIPYDVLTRIIDETYQRSVGPHVHTLNRYSAFSSEVYGELMPSLTSEIISLTGINTNSLLIDLGSGVGNVVMQASLQSGCRSFGIELMQAPAKIAKEQLQQFKTRCRMWGVSMGEVELEEGDMLTSARVTELLPQADVVLVNNKVFLQSLNEALRPRFLDLKEGAIVVSLKPFVSSLNARVTERNVDDISAIFEVVERQYRSGGVSWGSNSGCYYLHRVDRAGYAGIRQRFEESRARSSRSRR